MFAPGTPVRNNFEGAPEIGSSDEEFACDLSERDIGEGVVINPVGLIEADKIPRG